jgi:tRNA(Ile)-lysidine synthase
VSARPLAERVRDALRRLGVAAGGEAPLVVALSGGLDSCVLLHLLRFGATDAPPVVAAHFDHAMRPGSVADARWVTGLCRAWSVPLFTGCADAAPRSEDAARRARYAFLIRVHHEVGARAIVTAHHADDQAETVLFRALRGTGLAGLVGIPEERVADSDAAPRIVRPLLDAWREELVAYAAGVGLRWREDPTNEHLDHARNVIRHELLPLAEDGVASGARASLVRLGRLAARDEEAWVEVLATVLVGLDIRHEAQRASPAGPPAAPERVSMERAAVLDLGEALRSRVLRHLVGAMGGALDEAATTRAVDFTASADSGRALDLGGGVVLRRELGRFVLDAPAAGPKPDPDRPLTIPNAGPGSGAARVGGRDLRCSWLRGRVEGPRGSTASLALARVAFPLVVRGREPGDRMTTSGGTKKLKQLLLEARIPSGQRDRVPVVADRSGRVLWVPGVGRASDVAATEDEEALTIGITE